MISGTSGRLTCSLSAASLRHHLLRHRRSQRVPQVVEAIQPPELRVAQILNPRALEVSEWHLHGWHRMRTPVPRDSDSAFTVLKTQRFRFVSGFGLFRRVVIHQANLCCDWVVDLYAAFSTPGYDPFFRVGNA